MSSKRGRTPGAFFIIDCPGGHPPLGGVYPLNQPRCNLLSRLGGGHEMRVFSYVVDKDGGYAPNPFHGICTLACCKPDVRRGAHPGDIVIGLTGVALGHRLVYAMVVSERHNFQTYWRDARFSVKKPDMCSPRAIDRCGDNHYEPQPDGTFRQLLSRHSEQDGGENLELKQRDLGRDGTNPVLVGNRFCYFGEEAIALPAELRFLPVGRGCRCRFTPAQVALVAEFVASLPQGLHAPPHLWPAGDESWRIGANGRRAPGADAAHPEEGPRCAPRPAARLRRSRTRRC
jgi:hypothetical protein